MMRKHQRKIVAVLAGILVLALVISLVSVIFMTTAGAVSRSEISALESEKAALQAQQEQMQGRIDELMNEQDAVLEQKAALDEQNELNRQELEIINEQIELYDALILEKEAELEEAIAAEEHQSELYRKRMRVMEEHGGMQYLSVLFQANSFSDFLSRLSMIEEVMASDNKLEEDLTAAREHTEEVKAEYEATQEEQKEVKAELLEKKEELEAEIEVAYELLADVEANLLAVQEAFEEGEAKMDSLNSDITSMLAELARQEAEAAKNNGGNPQGPASSSGSGSFTWPLPGYAASDTYGPRLHPILGYVRTHAGEDIGAPSGTPILAADSGTVVTNTYNAGGYGNYVIINHGNGYATLYGHMTSSAVTLGQTVAKGQVIGYVGSTGLSTGPHLHFEVRLNGSVTDPLSYSYS